jgi:hypothetical protein
VGRYYREDAKAYALLIRLPVDPAAANAVREVLRKELARYPDPRTPYDVKPMGASVNPHSDERYMTPARGGPVLRLGWNYTGYSPV